jgi:hypothetical protein
MLEEMKSHAVYRFRILNENGKEHLDLWVLGWHTEVVAGDLFVQSAQDVKLEDNLEKMLGRLGIKEEESPPMIVDEDICTSKNAEGEIKIKYRKVLRLLYASSADISRYVLLSLSLHVACLTLSLSALNHLSPKHTLKWSSIPGPPGTFQTCLSVWIDITLSCL